MSEEMSREEIRLRERRSFDAFNEAQANKRQISRDRFAAAHVAVQEQEDESRRWVKREVDAGEVAKPGKNDSPGG